jgi:branched-chain amino acid transport system permease protein
MSTTVMQLIINGLLLGGIYALISIGLTLIFGVVEIINFAHGEFLMLSMYASYWLFQLYGVAPPLNQIFATVGVSLVLQNAALFFWKADYRTVRTAYSTLSLGGLMISTPRLVAFIFALAIIAALLTFLKRTYTGKAIRALAQEKRAAMLMGIDIYRMYKIAFGIGIACVGAAGAILIPIYYAFPTVGAMFVLIAFVVVILGGYNSLVGALIGGLIIGLVEAFSGFFLSPHLKEAVYFVIFILILLFRPTGLLGRA